MMSDKVNIKIEASTTDLWIKLLATVELQRDHYKKQLEEYKEKIKQLEKDNAILQEQLQ